MIFAAWVSLVVYGVLLIAGGFMGYAKAGSKASLIAGGISGLVALALGILAWQGHGWATPAGAVVAGLLGIMMLRRWLNSRKMMPAGMLVILSIVVLVIQVLAWRNGG